jgi:hypothetical protein
MPRCGAKNRQGLPCARPCRPNGRCKLHGGASTDPNTKEGIERIRVALTIHGRYSAAAKQERRALRELLRSCRESLAFRRSADV